MSRRRRQTIYGALCVAFIVLFVIGTTLLSQLIFWLTDTSSVTTNHISAFFGFTSVLAAVPTLAYEFMPWLKKELDL